MSIKKGTLAALAAFALAASVQLPGFTASIDILRSVPLEIKQYPEAKNFPGKFTTAEQVLAAIDSTPNLLVHMEAIRRGYHDLDAEQAEKLLSALFKRHQTDEKDLMHGFNHGYAQLVFKHNKTGLFFLRKANDKFKDQFSSLAYGMAEVEADINLENAKPEEMTMRKLDVTFQLSDAVKRDAEKHQPGFWPSYMRVIEKVKTVPALSSFARRDFSLAYLPYGNSVIPMRGAMTVSLPLKASPSTLLSNAMTTSCNPDAVESGSGSATATGAAISQRSADFNGNVALIQFFNTEQAGLYRVRVTGSDSTPMLSFKTYAMPHIVEDLEGDGTFEIVARQYKQDPLNPVLVYRYTPCGFELDKKVFNTFQ